MLDNFKNFIKKEKLFGKNQKILLAVSGGIDSVVMSFLFKSAGYEFGIAHCNFKLRGKESDLDEEFVKQLAEKLKVPFHSISFDTEKIAARQKKSIQVAARQLRYQWFETLLNEFGYHAVATAHHASDSIETVLYNFTKGCGIRGLHGIAPKTGKIVRPLLFAYRTEIEQFAAKQKIAFREDSSNLSEKYMRNKIRKKIIPVLTGINPAFEKTAVETIGNLRETEAVFDWAIERIRNEVVEEINDLIRIRYTDIPQEGISTILYELLKPFGFNPGQCRQILFDEHAQSGAAFFSESHRLVIARKYYVIDKIETKNELLFSITPETERVVLEDLEFVFEILNELPDGVSKDSSIAQLDFERLEFPLPLRKWKPGDHFQPLGMNGKRQKLQDFFTHRKLSIPEKEKIWILESNGNICWVAGLRIDERYKVRSDTKKYLQITLKKTR